MSLRDRIQTDITAAMRGGDSLRRDVLRMASNAAYNVEKRNQRPLTDDEYLAVLTREVKTRRESVEAYAKGGRDDLAAKEQAEIDILSEYLPQALTEAEVDALVDEGIAATGAASARDLGKVMGWLSRGPAVEPTARSSAARSRAPSLAGRPDGLTTGPATTGPGTTRPITDADPARAGPDAVHAQRRHAGGHRCDGF